MDIEKIFNLKDILIKDDNEQYVIISTKRNFLNEDSRLHVKPTYVKIKDILSEINTEKAADNIIQNMTTMEQRLSDTDCDYQRIEERISTGILIKRDKYDALYEMTKNYSERELLGTNVIDNSILAWGILNVVQLSPYMMRYRKNNKYEAAYTVVEPSSFVNVNYLCNYMRSLGYNVDIVKSSTDILRKSIMEKDKDPYQTLCSLILNNQGIYTNGIQYEYGTDIIITQNNNYKVNKRTNLIRTR